MELPTGWDDEVRALDLQKERDKPMFELLDELRAEVVKQINYAFSKAIAIPDIIRARGFAWQRIRENFEITHPEPKETFESDRDAAQVIIYYWAGEPVDSDLLEKSVMGIGDMDLYSRAMDYATNLTEPNSLERDYVYRANDYLWRHTGK